MLIIGHARSLKRIIATGNLDADPESVDYVESYGDGSSHGATWENFLNYLQPLMDGVVDLRDSHSVERQLDGLLNMSYEGAVRHGSGWSTIATGLQQAQTHTLQGEAWSLHGFFNGLGYIAANFAERDSPRHL